MSIVMGTFWSSSKDYQDPVVESVRIKVPWHSSDKEHIATSDSSEEKKEKKQYDRKLLLESRKSGQTTMNEDFAEQVRSKKEKVDLRCENRTVRPRYK